MIESLLSQKKTAVLKRWFTLILESYPPDSRGFLKRENDRFTNPVGYTIFHEIETIYNELLEGTNCDKLAESLENIIKIRAVQDFSPSEAVAFVFDLKKAIRESLEKEINGNQLFEELLKFEIRIDETALIAFEIYMKCREKIHEIRMNEVKGRSLKKVERC